MTALEPIKRHSQAARGLTGFRVMSKEQCLPNAIRRWQQPLRMGGGGSKTRMFSSRSSKTSHKSWSRSIPSSNLASNRVSTGCRSLESAAADGAGVSQSMSIFSGRSAVQSGGVFGKSGPITTLSRCVRPARSFALSVSFMRESSRSESRSHPMCSISHSNVSYSAAGARVGFSVLALITLSTISCVQQRRKGCIMQLEQRRRCDNTLA
jgi:hypothetical protein